MKKIQKIAIFISIFSIFVGFPTTKSIVFSQDYLPDTETIVDTVALQAHSTTYLPQTFGYLAFVTDKLVTSVNDENPSDSDFCSLVDTYFTNQEDIDKQSFAWQKDSYTLPENAQDGMSEIQGSLYKETLGLRSDMIDEVEKVTSQDETSSLVLNRLKAIYRSVSIEVVDEYRKDSLPDQERVEALLDFQGKLIKCIETSGSVDEVNTEAVVNINRIHTEIVSLWFTNKPYLAGLTSNTESEKLTIKRTDLKDEDIYISSVGVSSLIDLEVFSKTMMHKDDRIKEVSIGDSKISFVYAVDAKFLGFGKTFLREKVTVDVLGNIKTRMPWYAFLFSKSDMYKNSEEIEQYLQDKNLLSKDIPSGDFIAEDYGAQAVLFENIVRSISENLENSGK